MHKFETSLQVPYSTGRIIQPINQPTAVKHCKKGVGRLNQVTCNGCPKRGEANQSCYMPEQYHGQANQQSQRTMYVMTYFRI
jgi:hypothetical protein